MGFPSFLSVNPVFRALREGGQARPLRTSAATRLCIHASSLEERNVAAVWPLRLLA